MKYLPLAFLTAIILSVIIYFCFFYFIDADLAKALVALPVAGFNKIAEAFESLASRRSLSANRPPMIQSFEGYAISWPLLLVSGTLMIIAIAEGASALSSFITSNIADIAAGNRDEWVPKSQTVLGVGNELISIPLMWIGGYLVGRWIGTRSARYGIAVVLMSAVLGCGLVALADYFLAPPEFFALFGVTDVRRALIKTASLNVGIFSISGIVGYWRGHRLKLSRYLRYLLSVLPNGSRNAVIELAVEEAQGAIASVAANK